METSYLRLANTFNLSKAGSKNKTLLETAMIIRAKIITFAPMRAIHDMKSLSPPCISLNATSAPTMAGNKAHTGYMMG